MATRPLVPFPHVYGGELDDDLSPNGDDHEEIVQSSPPPPLFAFAAGTRIVCPSPGVAGNVTDQDIINSAAVCGKNLIQTTNINVSLSINVWADVEDSVKKAAAIAATTVVVTEIVVNVLIQLGMSVLADVLEALLMQILGYIMTALTLGAVTTVATAAAIGSAAGYIGTIIGAIIGLVTAGVELVVGGPTIQITNGTTVKCQDYAKINMPSAVTWMQSQSTLMGFTPKWLADTFGLFLANPVWMTINQGLLGVHYPPVPDAGTGSPVDIVYTQLPGAFELLNRAQLAEASAIVGVSPSKLPFFAAIPALVHAQMAAVQNGTPIPTQPAPMNPDPVLAHWATFQYPTPKSDGSPCTDFATCRYGTVAWAPGPTVNDPDVENYPIDGTHFLYSACPNLMTNSNTVQNPPPPGNPGVKTKVLTQTDPSPAACQLQVMYPSLTTDQCQRIFKVHLAAYEFVVQQATNWALGQDIHPDDGNGNFSQQFGSTVIPGYHSISDAPNSVQLGSGSVWNLEPADVLAIQAAWEAAHPNAAAIRKKGWQVHEARLRAKQAAAAAAASSPSPAPAPTTPAHRPPHVIGHNIMHAQRGAIAAASSAAIRRAVMGKYVSRYVSPQQGAAIEAGKPTPRGTGHFDRSLPLALEVTVEAMINGDHDPTELAELANALAPGVR